MSEVNTEFGPAVSRAKAAEMLGFHPVTLRRLAARGDGPAFIVLNGKQRPTYRYPLAWLDDWAKAKAE